MLPRTNLAFTGGRWYKINAGLACRLEELGDVGVAKKTTHTHHTHIHTHTTHTHHTHTHHTHITHTHHTHITHTYTHIHTPPPPHTHNTHTHHTHTHHTHITHKHTTHTSHTHIHTQTHTHTSHTHNTHTPTHTHNTHTQTAAFCVAGVALGDIHFRYAWQKVTSTVVLCGRRGTDGTGWRAWTGLGAAVTPRHSAWQAWHLVTSTLISRSRRGTTSHLPSFCVAGVGQMALGGALGLV